MFHRTRLLMAVVLPMVIILGFCNNVSKAPKELLVDGVVGVLKYQHYQPIPIDDSFSNRVFTLFLDQLDERKLFFTAKDVSKFESYKYSIDDEIKNKKYDGINDIITTYKLRIKEANEFSNETFGGKFNLMQNKKFTIPDTDRNECKNQKKLKQYWKNYSTFLVMENYVRKLINQEGQIKKLDTAFKAKPLDTLMAKAIMEVSKNQKE